MHRIAYPIGGLGNHIRWLCLLSPEYNNFDTINSVGFFTNGKMFPFDSDKKVKFIEEVVYPITRTCFNYIQIELQFKNVVNQYFQTTHYIEDFTELYKPYKTILVTSSVENCIKHYFKFHPLWNGNAWKKATKDEFTQKILLTNESHINYKHNDDEEVLHTTSDVLNNSVLDYDFYNDICNFLNITNVYDHANKCHQSWYNLQRKSESLILEYFRNAKYPDFPWTTYKEKYANANVYDESDWNMMKDTILQLYG